MIGRSGERGSGISVLAARHDDDDDDNQYKSNTSNKTKYNNYYSYNVSRQGRWISIVSTSTESKRP